MAVIKDVAGLAGLSVSVISKYLKNPASVRPDTKLRIESAINELNYVPSTQARALRTGKTGMISIISPNITNPFFAELFSAIQSEALKRGYIALLQTISMVDEAEESVVSQAFAVSSTSRVDGMIVCFPDEEKIFGFLKQQWKNVPNVLLSWNENRQASANIVVDVEKGIYTTTKYLLSKGHKSIGYVGAPGNSTTSQEKQKGFFRAMCEENKAITDENIFHGKYSPETGYAALQKFRQNMNKPTAIITEADIFAVGCIKYCHEYNIDVPTEMAVTGFDDIPIAALYHPPITTIRLPIQEMGKQAVDTLSAMMKSKDNANHFCYKYETEIVIRRSTDAEYSV